jgi:serine/threonine protein kinase
MAIYLSNEEIKNLKPLEKDTLLMNNYSIYIKDNDTLYKFLDEKNDSYIKYLISLPNHPNIIKPQEIIYFKEKNKDYKFGYEMPYLKNARDFLETYKLHLSYEKKLKYCLEVFNALEYLHQFIVLGDIHSENILISNDTAYLIDLDYSKKIFEVLKMMKCLYHLNNSLENKYTDIIKLYIECLSLILEINLSKFFKIYTYKGLSYVLNRFQLPQEIADFLEISQNKKAFKDLGNEAYKFENFMNPDVLNLKKDINTALINWY